MGRAHERAGRIPNSPGGAGLRGLLRAEGATEKVVELVAAFHGRELLCSEFATEVKDLGTLLTPAKASEEDLRAVKAKFAAQTARLSKPLCLFPTGQAIMDAVDTELLQRTQDASLAKELEPTRTKLHELGDFKATVDGSALHVPSREVWVEALRVHARTTASASPRFKEEHAAAAAELAAKVASVHTGLNTAADAMFHVALGCWFDRFCACADGGDTDSQGFEDGDGESALMFEEAVGKAFLTPTTLAGLVTETQLKERVALDDGRRETLRKLRAAVGLWPKTGSSDGSESECAAKALADPRLQTLKAFVKDASSLLPARPASPECQGQGAFVDIARFVTTCRTKLEEVVLGRLAALPTAASFPLLKVLSKPPPKPVEGGGDNSEGGGGGDSFWTLAVKAVEGEIDPVATAGRETGRLFREHFSSMSAVTVKVPTLERSAPTGGAPTPKKKAVAAAKRLSLLFDSKAGDLSVLPVAYELVASSKEVARPDGGQVAEPRDFQKWFSDADAFSHRLRGTGESSDMSEGLALLCEAAKTFETEMYAQATTALSDHIRRLTVHLEKLRPEYAMVENVENAEFSSELQKTLMLVAASESTRQFYKEYKSLTEATDVTKAVAAQLQKNQNTPLADAVAGKLLALVEGGVQEVQAFAARIVATLTATQVLCRDLKAGEQRALLARTCQKAIRTRGWTVPSNLEIALAHAAAAEAQ